MLPTRCLTGNQIRERTDCIGVSFVLGCEAGAVWSLSDASLGGTRPIARWGAGLGGDPQRRPTCNIRAISTGVQGGLAVNCGHQEMACEQQLGSLWLVSEVR